MEAFGKSWLPGRKWPANKIRRKHQRFILYSLARFENVDWIIVFPAILRLLYVLIMFTGKTDLITYTNEKCECCEWKPTAPYKSKEVQDLIINNKIGNTYYLPALLNRTSLALPSQWHECWAPSHEGQIIKSQSSSFASSKLA